MKASELFWILLVLFGVSVLCIIAFVVDIFVLAMDIFKCSVSHLIKFLKKTYYKLLGRDTEQI